MASPLLRIVGDEPPPPPPPVPVDPMAYVTIPQAAKAAWDAMQGPLSRVRPTFAGSYAVEGRVAASAEQFEAIAIAAIQAAAAIREGRS